MKKTTLFFSLLKDRTVIAAACMLVAVFSLWAGFLFPSRSSSLALQGSRLGQETIRQYAAAAISQCASASHRPSCYDREVPKLMDSISLEDAFHVTAAIQEKDTEFRYCHVLGHNLSAREVKKDPSRWKEVVTRCPSGVCSNGCIHGGFQERFRAESLSDGELKKVKPDLEDLCEPRGQWRPTGLEQGSCYHALGHLAMYLTNADIFKAVNVCEEIAQKPHGQDWRQICFDGAFMQIFQPLEPEDFALVKGKQPTKEELPSFCAQFDGPRRGSCWSEGWPLFDDEVTRPDGLMEFCARTLPEEQDRCFSSLFYVLTVQFQFEVARMKTFCAGFPPARSGQCFANVASRLIETDYRNIPASIKLCTDAIPYDPGAKCFQELLTYSTFNFHRGSAEFFQICNALPEVWRTKCLNP